MGILGAEAFGSAPIPGPGDCREDVGAVGDLVCWAPGSPPGEQQQQGRQRNPVKENEVTHEVAFRSTEIHDDAGAAARFSSSSPV